MDAIYIQAQELHTRYLLGIISRDYYEKEAQHLIKLVTTDRDKDALTHLLDLDI